MPTTLYLFQKRHTCTVALAPLRMESPYRDRSTSMFFFAVGKIGLVESAITLPNPVKDGGFASKMYS